jgi:hypothetical protein
MRDLPRFVEWYSSATNDITFKCNQILKVTDLTESVLAFMIVNSANHSQRMQWTVTSKPACDLALKRDIS